MIFFTSDHHFDETRITPDFNPFFRPFKSVREQNEVMIRLINDMVGEDDELFHIGDVAVTVEGIALMDHVHCKNKTLILGNYDVDKPEKMEALKTRFSRIEESLCMELPEVTLHLNHYPIKAVPHMFNIVGHIHGLWKVQPNMVNVGVDAWHFRPVRLDTILFIKNAIENHYDKNVFPCCD